MFCSVMGKWYHNTDNSQSLMSDLCLLFSEIFRGESVLGLCHKLSYVSDSHQRKLTSSKVGNMNDGIKWRSLWLDHREKFSNTC